jgi:predicted Zn finger-like uncharacterized protein
LFTVCPKCTLTLVVTTVDLRAGQGYVRCGRCANVFNALVALREGDPSGGTSDSASRRLSETAPKPPAQPAMGSGVADEPEPPPGPEPEPEPEPPPEPDAAPEPEVDLAAELRLLPDSEAAEPAAADLDLSFEAQAAEPEEGSLEFDATATDVSEIFIAPEAAEHDTGSGNYEAVVLAVEPQPDPVPDAQSEEPQESVEAHTDTIAADDWSLLDDDEPPADAESVIEESPLAQAVEPEPEPDPDMQTQETVSADPAWVQEMFAEAEAEAVRARTAEHKVFTPPAEVDEEEPAVVRAARDVKGVSAASGDTVLEPLLAPSAPRRPAWQSIGGIAALSLALLLQIVHHNRQALVLSPSVGPMVSTVYGWFGVTLTPRWDLTAYSVMQQGVEPEGTRLRVRLSVQNDSERVQPLPLVRLTLKDRYGNPVATRDLTPAEYLPPRAAGQRLLEPDQRIDAELHVMDPGQAAVGFEIDACLRAENGSVGCANDVRNKPAAG